MRLCFICLVSFLVVIGCSSPPDSTTIPISEIPAGRYRIYELTHACVDRYGPVERYVDVTIRDDGFVLEGLTDIATKTDVFLPSDPEALSAGNVNVMHAFVKNGSVHLDLHACYVGDIKLSFDPE